MLNVRLQLVAAVLWELRPRLCAEKRIELTQVKNVAVFIFDGTLSLVDGNQNCFSNNVLTGFALDIEAGRILTHG